MAKEPIENASDQDPFFEEIVKKTKTGITFPKILRESLFEENEDVFFKLVVPREKDKIILEFLSEEELEEQMKKTSTSKPSSVKRSVVKKAKAVKDSGPIWNEYFVYNFESQEKLKPILESAYYKFAEKPINFEDAMGRVKYGLISFLTSTKTENAKLYFSVIKFLIDIIEKFNLPNLIDWIFEKIVPNIESKFLYEQALLELVEIALKMNRYEQAELFIFYVLKNIDEYARSELYNIFNSFKELVKRVKYIERTQKIDVLLKEKLLEYGQGVEGVDYKIQIVEFLEDLNYIEAAYFLAKEIQVSLPPDSMKLEDVRKLVRRLHSTPITENKRL